MAEYLSMPGSGRTRWLLNFLSAAGVVSGAAHGFWAGYRTGDADLAWILTLVGRLVTGSVAMIAFLGWQLARLGFMLLWHRVGFGSRCAASANRSVFHVVSGVSGVSTLVLAVWAVTTGMQAIASSRGGPGAGYPRPPDQNLVPVRIR